MQHFCAGNKVTCHRFQRDDGQCHTGRCYTMHFQRAGKRHLNEQCLIMQGSILSNSYSLSRALMERWPSKVEFCR